MDTCGFLQNFIAELGKISADITQNLARVMQELNQMAMMALLRLREIEDRCKELIDDLKTGGFSSFGGKSPDHSNWTLPKLHVENLQKRFFVIEGDSQEFLMLGRNQLKCLIHGFDFIQSLTCLKDHCRQCLAEFVRSGVSVCPCGFLLTPKEKHQIMNDS